MEPGQVNTGGSALESAVQERLRRAEALEASGQHLGAMLAGVDRLASALAGLADSPDSALPRVHVTQATLAARTALATQRDALAQLHARFASGRITVAAIGRARQGKSRFLQSLTGLGDQVIPDSNAGYCTGVSSVIRNGRPSRATVHFLTAAGYLEIIQRYHAELGRSAPASLSGFWLATPAPTTGDSAAQAAVRSHLLEHWAAREAVSKLLDGPPREVMLADLRNWVSQSGGGGSVAHMAVDRVEIVVPYTSGSALLDVIDLPGLGDTNLTDIDRFVSALRDTADVLVLIRMPAATGDDWGIEDTRLASEAERALGGLPLGGRLFLLLNRTRTPDNEHNVERMRHSAVARGISHLAADVVDASSDTEVARYFAGMASSVPAIVGDGDRRLLAAQAQGLHEARRVVNSMLAAASELVSSVQPLPEARRQKLLDDAVDQLVAALDTLRQDLANDRGFDDGGLAARIMELVDQAYDQAPAWVSAAEFARRAAGKSGVAGAYAFFLNESRARLLAHFSGLDPQLRAHMERTKARVAQMLLGDGRMAGLPGLDATSTLADIGAVLLDERLGMPADSFIVGAIDTLQRADLAYRGFLQHRVRRALADLDPDKPLYPLSQFESPGTGLSGVPAQLFVDAVVATINNSLQKVAALLEEANLDAHWASRALVDEFVHRATGGPDAVSQWRAVYSRFQESIWQAEFSAAAANSSATAAAVQALDHLRGLLAQEPGHRNEGATR